MIRKIEKRDYEKIIKLVYQVHELHYKNRPDIYNDKNPLSKEDFENIINDESTLNFLYEEAGKVLGIIMTTKKQSKSIPIIKERNTYFIEDIVVDNNHRRKGIGKALYEYLVNIAKSNNIDSIELNVWSFNTNAIKFYESLGMSVRNMKLENILDNKKVEVAEKNIKVTNKVL